MISWDFDPFYVRGGSAYATRRLADQLTALGIETRVLLPDRGNSFAGGATSLLKPTPVTTRADFRDAARVLQCAEFCRAAVPLVEQIQATSGSDAVIAHGDEGAMFFVMRNGSGSSAPTVFWLHSLYDPSLAPLSPEQRRLLSSQSLLASAVMKADIVVTSQGILKDAEDLEWPGRLNELQQALVNASSENRVLTVESVGCLPEIAKHPAERNSNSNLDSLSSLPSPYVLFPCRPSIDKGRGIFDAFAERLKSHGIACVAVQRPGAAKLQRPTRDGVRWLPWLGQDELLIAMRNATCTVMPSLTEGFGLAAAESIRAGVRTLYHEVGGHHDLDGQPHAQKVPLTRTERERLYRLWLELVDTDPDSSSVWSRHESSLQRLVGNWVEAIRRVVHQQIDGAPGTGLNDTQLAKERWANKLCDRIAAGATHESH